MAYEVRQRHLARPMTIHVFHPFFLTLTDGALPRAFRAGEHEVEDAIAAHWYVRAHSEVRPHPSEASAAPAAQPAKPRKSKSK